MPVKAEQRERAADIFNRRGFWNLLLAWTPVIGDPLTFVTGVLRAPFAVFIVLVAVAKTGRYMALLGLVGQLTG